MQLRLGHEVRQTQSLKISQQALQSIRILQMTTRELREFLHGEAERNPMLDVQFPEAGQSSSSEAQSPAPTSSGLSRAGSLPGIAETEAYPITLRDHLHSQAMLTFDRAETRTIAAEIVGSIEPDGYLRRPTAEIARHLGLAEHGVLDVLARIQEFDPCGVGARDLAECLRLQLAEHGELCARNISLLTNLSLLAKYDFDALARICGCGREDVLNMIERLKKLNPAPGRQFDTSPTQLSMPDVILTQRDDGDFRVELNPDILPKALFDRDYYSLIQLRARDKTDRKFITDCMRNATWLVQNLDKRAHTILLVTTEIVAQQRDFFLHGANHLKPMCLKDIADAVGVHQSTVSRAISNKHLNSPRGLIALKFFFSKAIATSNGTFDLSSEVVRNRIKSLIEAEAPTAVLSDDAIVKTLDRAGVTIARRTVAKYRMMLRIPSSAMRKRMKSGASRQPSPWRQGDGPPILEGCEARQNPVCDAPGRS